MKGPVWNETISIVKASIEFPVRSTQPGLSVRSPCRMYDLWKGLSQHRISSNFPSYTLGAIAAEHISHMALSSGPVTSHLPTQSNQYFQWGARIPEALQRDEMENT